MTQTSLEASLFTDTQVSEAASIYVYSRVVQLGNNSHIEREFREVAERVGVPADRLEELHVAAMRHIVDRKL